LTETVASLATKSSEASHDTEAKIQTRVISLGFTHFNEAVVSLATKSSKLEWPPLPLRDVFHVLPLEEFVQQPT